MKRVGVREMERKSMWSENEETDMKSRERESEREEAEIG